MPEDAWPDINRLRELSGTHTEPSWEMASIVYRLVHEHGMTQERIGELVDLARNTVSEHVTSWKYSLDAEEEMPDFRQRFGVHKAKKISSNYRQVPLRIRDEKTVADYAKESLTKTPRQVRTDWAEEEQKEASQRNAENVPAIMSQHDLGERVNNGCCLDWMDAEVKEGNRYRVIYGDPPYAYNTYDKLPVDHSQTSGLATECETRRRKML